MFLGFYEDSEKTCCFYIEKKKLWEKIAKATTPIHMKNKESLNKIDPKFHFIRQ